MSCCCSCDNLFLGKATSLQGLTNRASLLQPVLATLDNLSAQRSRSEGTNDDHNSNRALCDFSAAGAVGMPDASVACPGRVRNRWPVNIARSCLRLEFSCLSLFHTYIYVHANNHPDVYSDGDVSTET